MRTIALGLNAAALRLLLLAALLAAAWLGLNFSFPNLAPSGIPNTVTRIIINGIILIGLWRGLYRTDFTARTRVAVWLAIAVPLTLWAALVQQLAVQGAFRPIPGVTRVLPLLPVAIFVPVVVGLVLLTRSKRIAALLDVTPPSWLIGLQVYRVLGGAFLVNWAHGAIPGSFALPAGIGDIAVGLLALPAALWVSSGTQAGRKLGIMWNLLGLADFAVAITMGILSSPGPLQVIALNRPNTLIGTFPTVMIPAFAVPSSIILHALSLWQLKRMERRMTAFAPD
jgi:hypothetical protein